MPTRPPVLVTGSGDFGSQQIGEGRKPQVIRVSNSGGSSLHVGSVEVAGADGRDFAIQKQDCSNRDLGPSQSCSVVVSFAPQTAGHKIASLALHDNAPGGPHSVSLKGNASARSSAALEPSDGLNFGQQIVGGPSRTLGIVLHNTGSTELTPGIRIDGQDADQFPLNPRECTVRAVQAGRSCNLIVEFRPLRVGNSGVTLTVADESGKTLTSAPLTGAGIRSLPRVKFDRPFVDFTKSPIQSLRLWNVGESPLLIKTIRPEGDGAGAVSADAGLCLQRPINPKESCEIRLQFSPHTKAAAAGRAILYVFDNGVESPQHVPLQWHSPAPSIITIPPKPPTRLPTVVEPKGPSPISHKPTVPPVTVPPVTDHALDEARSILDRSHLQMGAVHPRQAQARPGTVLDQYPRKGAQVPVGSAVDVWVATPQKVPTKKPTPPVG